MRTPLLSVNTYPFVGGVRIEDDCWIGAGAIILNGITIGKGSVVGAGAVVTKDVPPYTIVAGNPAHKIKEIHTPKAVCVEIVAHTQ